MGGGDSRGDGGVEGAVGEDIGGGRGWGDRCVGGGGQEFVGDCRGEEKHVGGGGEGNVRRGVMRGESQNIPYHLLMYSISIV